MNKFAKLFETEECGQIVAMQGASDDGDPAIHIHFQPSGLGVCSTSLIYEDSDDGWDRMEADFEKLSEELAVSTVKGTAAFTMFAKGDLVQEVQDDE